MICKKEVGYLLVLCYDFIIIHSEHSPIIQVSGKQNENEEKKKMHQVYISLAINYTKKTWRETLESHACLEMGKNYSNKIINIEILYL